MPNHNEKDNVTNLKDFKKKPKSKRHLNGASAQAEPSKNWSQGWRKKFITAVQFVLMAALTLYFMQTCNSVFPH